MRKFYAIFLSLCIVISLAACGTSHSDARDQYHFYYLRADILYGSEDGVISCEYRDKDQTAADTILNQYLRGPVSEHLVSPSPNGTEILSVEISNDSLLVILSAPFSQLSDMEHTLACACLAKTCYSVYDVSSVTVRTEDSDKSITLTRDSMTFTDISDTIHYFIGTESQTP